MRFLLCFLACQLVNRGEKPFYEITGDQTKHVSPEDVAKLIFHKMKGNNMADSHNYLPLSFNRLSFHYFNRPFGPQGGSWFHVFVVSPETAQSALGSDVNEAVITVPFEFAQAQKSALR